MALCWNQTSVLRLATRTKMFYLIYENVEKQNLSLSLKTRELFPKFRLSQSREKHLKPSIGTHTTEAPSGVQKYTEESPVAIPNRWAVCAVSHVRHLIVLRWIKRECRQTLPTSQTQVHLGKLSATRRWWLGSLMIGRNFIYLRQLLHSERRRSTVSWRFPRVGLVLTDPPFSTMSMQSTIEGEAYLCRR